ncbi:MAG: SDR family oxidoreductase [Rubrivivax sp.]|jgi:3-oxoacyl-[acyl-carrier protein] reductase/2-hydroxycyclohexanecarboxyl-CoA dehydrogenase|nr:SDR family oxidoreductase [Rubrivivax sp.]MBK7260396.1 SDR family oxidoreductase [Rubrivivax sp.]MBK8526072.1 SDR family oxidoreductase [Rubrivivax sp.]
MNTDSLHGNAAPEVREADPGRGCRRLGGRTALLTAAARGIGFASAVRLAAEGAQVWITDRDEAALAQAAQAAAAAGLRLHTQCMDSSNAADVASSIAAVLAQAGRVDVLVNNAGGSLHTPFRLLDETDAHWQQVMDLNVMGAVWASRAVLPAMAAQGFGRIVNFGSKAGRFGSLIAGPNYAAAKGAIAALTRQMAQEFGPQGISVNCICPGVVMTERTRGLWAERRSAEERERVLKEIPLRRHAEVEDVAAAVAWLVSDDAAFITGITLDLNGGQGMG